MSERDPNEIPILAELEREFQRMVAETLAPAPAARAKAAPMPSPPTHAPTPGRPRRRHSGQSALSTGRRILGRAAVAGALVGVVGATALATQSIVRRDPAPAEPVVLQRAAGHELVLRHFHGRLCLDVSYAAGVASRCVASPKATGTAPLSALTAEGRVVAGITGAAVLRVVVESSGRTVAVTTQAISDPVRHGLRWFATLLPAVPRARLAAALVTPQRASGRAVGPPVADCTLGSVASCHAARASAVRHPR